MTGNQTRKYDSLRDVFIQAATIAMCCLGYTTLTFPPPSLLQDLILFAYMGGGGVGALRGQKRGSHPVELDLQAVVSCLMQVLGTGPGSPKTTNALPTEPHSSPTEPHSSPIVFPSEGHIFWLKHSNIHFLVTLECCPTGQQGLLLPQPQVSGDSLE